MKLKWDASTLEGTKTSDIVQAVSNSAVFQHLPHLPDWSVCLREVNVVASSWNYLMWCLPLSGPRYSVSATRNFELLNSHHCGIALWLSCSALHATAGSERQLGKSCLPPALHSAPISVSIASQPPSCHLLSSCVLRIFGMNWNKCLKWINSFVESFAWCESVHTHNLAHSHREGNTKNFSFKHETSTN